VIAVVLTHRETKRKVLIQQRLVLATNRISGANSKTEVAYE